MMEQGKAVDTSRVAPRREAEGWKEQGKAAVSITAQGKR